MKWQHLLGHMTSLEKLTRCGRLHMRPVQFTLHDQWSQSSDPLFFLCALHQSFFQSYAGGLFQSASPQECSSTSPCRTYACSPMPPVRAGGSPPLAPDRGPLGLSPDRGPLGLSPERLHINVLELLAVCLHGPAALPAPCPGPAGNGYDRQHSSRRSAAQSGGGCCQGPFTAALPNCCSGPTVTTSP